MPDQYTGTLQHTKKPSKTIKENHSQPFSCAVLPQEICHRHLYFLFPPTSETSNTPLLVPLILTISERCFCTYHDKMCETPSKATLYTLNICPHTLAGTQTEWFYMQGFISSFLNFQIRTFITVLWNLLIYILNRLFFKSKVLVRIRILPKKHYLCKFFLRHYQKNPPNPTKTNNHITSPHRK